MHGSGKGGPCRRPRGSRSSERAHYDEIGFIVLPRVRRHGSVRAHARPGRRGGPAQASGHAGAHRRRGVAGLVLPEANLPATTRRRAGRARPERLQDLQSCTATRVRGFAASASVTDLLVDLIGPSLDCFLSQFIFKNPGAWGQPWHQDSFYFPFEPARPIVGVWLAVSEATLENGCLWVLPGSHHEAIHEHVGDRRPGANYGYVEIVDHDMDGAIPCSWSRATCCCSTVTSCTARPTTIDGRAGRDGVPLRGDGDGRPPARR